MRTAFDWNDLRYFLSVARTGRLTAAARVLGTDHTTISRRVAALEKNLGAKLFERSPRGYALTEPGERLLQHAERIETEASHIHDDIAGELYAISGTIRIGSPDGLGAFFLAHRLADLALMHPELQIQLVATPRQFSLSKREADIAIVLSRPEKGRLFSRKLTDYTLNVYGRPDYLEEHVPIGCREDISKHLLFSYISELLYAPELDYFTLIAGDMAPRFSSTNVVAQMKAAAAGKGLAILPDFLALHAPELVPVRPDLFEICRTFWLVAHQDLRDSARLRTVMGFLVEQMAGARDEFLPGLGAAASS